MKYARAIALILLPLALGADARHPSAQTYPSKPSR